MRFWEYLFPFFIVGLELPILSIRISFVQNRKLACARNIFGKSYYFNYMEEYRHHVWMCAWDKDCKNQRGKTTIRPVSVKRFVFVIKEWEMRVNLCRRFAQTHKFRDVKKKILRTHLHQVLHMCVVLCKYIGCVCFSCGYIFLYIPTYFLRLSKINV